MIIHIILIMQCCVICGTFPSYSRLYTFCDICFVYSLLLNQLYLITEFLFCGFITSVSVSGALNQSLKPVKAWEWDQAFSAVRQTHQDTREFQMTGPYSTLLTTDSKPTSVTSIIILDVLRYCMKALGGSDSLSALVGWCLFRTT